MIIKFKLKVIVEESIYSERRKENKVSESFVNNYLRLNSQVKSELKRKHM